MKDKLLYRYFYSCSNSVRRENINIRRSCRDSCNNAIGIDFGDTCISALVSDLCTMRLVKKFVPAACRHFSPNCCGVAGCQRDSSFVDCRFCCVVISLMRSACGTDISLLAKWLPSVNASSRATVKTAAYLARHLHMTSAEYRKTLSILRSHIRIIENNLRTRDYSFDYSKQPSKALYKYRRAFLRNDRDRYSEFLNKAAAGECTVHTASLTPYDIIAPVFSKDLSDDERHIMDVTWDALDDFTDGENSIAVVDGSGSMYCGGKPLPAAVAMTSYFGSFISEVAANHVKQSPSYKLKHFSRNSNISERARHNTSLRRSIAAQHHRSRLFAG